MIVIADSTPLHYLLLIDQTDLLPRLFDRVMIPPAVFAELQHADTPAAVKSWIADPPTWLQVRALSAIPDPALDYLDAGKRDAITLAQELRADTERRAGRDAPRPRVVHYAAAGFAASGVGGSTADGAGGAAAGSATGRFSVADVGVLCPSM